MVENCSDIVKASYESIDGMDDWISLWAISSRTPRLAARPRPPKAKAAASKKKPVKASGGKKAVKVAKARPAVPKMKIVMPTALTSWIESVWLASPSPQAHWIGCGVFEPRL